MYCPKCGHNNEEQARFCEECGTPLEQRQKTQCPRCKAVIQQEGVRYCPECGYPLFQEEVRSEGTQTVVGTEQYDPGRIQTENDFKPFVEETSPQPPQWEQKEKEKGTSMVLVAVLGVLATVLAVTVIGLAIWYTRLSKEADSYEVPDFSEIIEESTETGDTSQTAEEQENPQVTVTATPTVTLAPTATPAEAPEEHRYELVIEDCTWEEARQKCADKGGYLAVLETEEEWQALIQTIELNGLSDKQFFIGAKRDLNSSTYYWVDAQNQLTGESLNDENSVMKSHWMQGEPSYQDQGTPEYCVNMYYYKNEGRWVLNDIPNAILEAVKSYSGKIGYICEYEE